MRTYARPGQPPEHVDGGDDAHKSNPERPHLGHRQVAAGEPAVQEGKRQDSQRQYVVPTQPALELNLQGPPKRADRRMQGQQQQRHSPDPDVPRDIQAD